VVAETAVQTDAVRSDRYDGEVRAAIINRLGLPRVELYSTIGSTMDEAHVLGATGAVAGTLVLADMQSAGRGRLGRVWRSATGAGIWLTVLERPREGSALDVLSLRIGLAVATALDGFAGDVVRLKWPNDLYLGERKLGGVLVEARWRENRPEWVAIGVGINLHPPEDIANAIGLPQAQSRLRVLESVMPAIRHAASRVGLLDEGELEHYAARDFASGRRCVSPAMGIVQGINEAGELAVRLAGDRVAYYRAGSLILEEAR
jgi:BirA family biotin operon repressor/biotin-[acetyl-CoA-carboxylase] ligase